MLYNSFPFIFVFLPIALLGFHLSRRLSSHAPQLLWLFVISCIFYAQWHKSHLVILLFSIIFNFSVGVTISRGVKPKILMAVGIAVNLAILFYFKYTIFFLDTLSDIFQTSAPDEIGIKQLALPLGISFFTFQQIMYLTDAYRGRLAGNDPLRYAVFVTFFPQLIAGPIVHHETLSRQLAGKNPRKVRSYNLAIGGSLFVLGLFKKVVLADNLAPYSDVIFAAAERGDAIDMLSAWLATLAYSFQIYFDFSGYSDMAIGLGRMFGIRLPVNFNSPYKAVSISDFWRRWHITLSTFLRDHLFIPLGGSHNGAARTALSLSVTMLLGGLWHGASWTFVLWGGAHGVMLVINHIWRRIVGNRGTYSWAKPVCVLVTFLAVSFAWVLFRAQSLGAAVQIYTALLGGTSVFDSTAAMALTGAPLHKVAAGLPMVAALVAQEPGSAAIVGGFGLVFGVLLLAWALPNSQSLMQYKGATVRGTVWAFLRWRPSLPWLITLLVLFQLSMVCLAKIDIRPFTYFAF